jgi:hypothetical protein
MSRTATFHARRLTKPRVGRASFYAGESEKALPFVVTDEGKVYERNTALFTRGQEFEFEYDARTGTTGTWSDEDVSGGAAKRLEDRIVASYSTLVEAKDKANEVFTAKSGKPSAQASPAPAPTPDAPPAADPAAGGGVAPGTEPPKDEKDIPWGYIAAGVGGVVVIGGIIYFATRK